MAGETLSQENIKIHNSINTKEWVKTKIAEVYQESNTDLTDLKKNITAAALENKLTIENVKNVLKSAADKFASGKTFTEVYGLQEPSANKEGMSAGLTLSLQIALTKLGYNPGPIDGVYMDLGQSKSKTRSAIEAFQKKYNEGKKPADQLVVDGWAGKNTIAKILEQLSVAGKPPLAPEKQEGKKQEEQEKNKDKIDNPIIPDKPENIDYLAKINEKYQWEPVGYMTLEGASKEGESIILKGKTYDIPISIIFDKDYVHPELKEGKDLFNLTLEGTKIWITKKQTEQEKKQIQEQINNMYKNSEFVFEGFVPQTIKNLFDKTRILDDYSLQLENDVVNKEIKADYQGVNKGKINLKDDFNQANYPSITIHFSKLEGQSVNFTFTIVKGDGPNGKKFIIKAGGIPGESGFEKVDAIRDTLLSLGLPEGWTKLPYDKSKPVGELPVIFDTQEPFDIHLRLKNNNQDYQIHFDKDGNLKPNQVISVDTKSYIVSIGGGKINLTEKTEEKTENMTKEKLEALLETSIDSFEKKGNIITVKLKEKWNSSYGFNNELLKFGHGTMRGDSLIIIEKKTFTINTNGQELYQNAIVLREFGSEEKLLRKQYYVRPIDMVESVSTVNNKITAKCKGGYDLEFNPDYTSPVLVYHGKKYPINIFKDSLNANWLTIRDTILPSLEKIETYKNNISLSGTPLTDTNIAFDVSATNVVGITFMQGTDKVSLYFTEEGKLKTSTVKINNQEHNVIITPEKQIKIEKISPSIIKLSFVKTIIDDFYGVSEKSDANGSFIKIQTNENILELIKKYEKYINNQNRNDLKNTISQMDGNNLIKSEFGAMTKKMDFLGKYKTILNNEQLLKNKGYEIITGANENIISLKKPKNLTQSEKIYISKDATTISISSAIDQINQDINSSNFSLENESLKNILSPFLEGISFENVINTVNAIKNDEVRNNIQNFLKDGNVVLAQEYIGMYRNSLYDDNKAAGKINEHMMKRLAQSKLLEKGADITNILAADVRDIYNNFLNNNLNNGKNYAIISKKDYTLYVFNAEHKFLSKHPVLLGKHPGDEVMQLKQSGSIFTTPGGSYTIDARSKEKEYAGPGDFLQLRPKDWQYPVDDFSIGIHTYYTVPAGEREKLLEKTTGNKRVTNGCINTLLEGSVYDNLGVGSVVYVAKES